MRSWFGLRTKVSVHARPVLSEREIQTALANECIGRPMKAVMCVLDQAILDRTSAAIDEKLSDPETKFYLGGAAALAALKEDLEYLTRPQE